MSLRIDSDFERKSWLQQAGSLAQRSLTRSPLKTASWSSRATQREDDCRGDPALAGNGHDELSRHQASSITAASKRFGAMTQTNFQR